MALTAEQQAQVDVQEAIAIAQTKAAEKEAMKGRKLQCVNVAHVTLLENKRNLPVEQRQITAAEITAFADSLMNYVNS
jgi:hypothetical protein